MGKIIFILGGVRSGKSDYAQNLAKKLKKKTAFVATAQALDSEMTRRIKRHQTLRPKGWVTYEEPKDIAGLLAKITPSFEVIVLDCLTLFVSNHILDNAKPKVIEKQINQACSVIKKSNCDFIVVSNEVGLGIVPENKLAREFRDCAGRINQLAARLADEVIFMVAGIPMPLRGRAIEH